MVVKAHARGFGHSVVCLPDAFTQCLDTFALHGLLTKHRHLLPGTSVQQAVKDDRIWLDACRGRLHHVST